MITDDRELAYLELSLVTHRLDIMQKLIENIQDIVYFQDFIKYNICKTECYNYMLKIVVDSESKVLVKHDGKALLVLRNVVRSNPTMVFDIHF